jgi:nitrogen permease regulator 2-like protein
MVPLALINLNKRVEPNWDLTIAQARFPMDICDTGNNMPFQVCKYIDGINHVSRIAYLADCDLELAREAIAHLL